MNFQAPIIAAVDLSSTSTQVLAHGAKMAAFHGCELIAAHAIPDSRLRDWAATMGRSASPAAPVEEVTSSLKELVAANCGDLNPRLEVRVGRPQKVLAEIARDHGAGLLVLGAHDVSKRRLGPVTAQCARGIAVDVLILRDWQERFFRRIVACVDFSPSSIVGLERAISLARIHRAELEILHVIFPPARDPWGKVMDQRMDAAMDYETGVRERAKAKLNAVLAPFSAALAGIESSQVFLESEAPSAAIAAHAEVTGIDLVVIGSQEGSWFSDFVIGSNAERLLYESTSSVLIARG
jgi:nucleotide-binding universal stress UspA family protein